MRSLESFGSVESQLAMQQRVNSLIRRLYHFAFRAAQRSAKETCAFKIRFKPFKARNQNLKENLLRKVRVRSGLRFQGFKFQTVGVSTGCDPLRKIQMELSSEATLLAIVTVECPAPTRLSRLLSAASLAPTASILHEHRLQRSN